MDGRGFDDLAWALARPVGRRRALLAALRAGAAGETAAFRAKAWVGAPAVQT